MNYRDLLPPAIALAVRSHGGTIGKDGAPYILHPLRLMLKADGYAEQIVAVLHDAVEDTALTLQELTDKGFPEEIVDAVGAVTKRPGEGYEALIERIAADPLAARVKLLDLYDNIDLMRLAEVNEDDLQRAAKYHRAIARLSRPPVSR